MKRYQFINNSRKAENKSSDYRKEKSTGSPFRKKFDAIIFRANKVKDDLLEFRSKYENKEISLLEYLSICRSSRNRLKNLQKELNKGNKNFKIKIY